MIDQIIQFFYYLLFFVTPLLMAKTTSELFEFNKMLFIYFVTVVITCLWLTKMIINKKIILKKTPLDVPIVVFLLTQIVSTIFSIDRHVSLFGYYGRFNGGLTSIISYLLLYYGYVSNNVNFEKTLKATLASSLIVILWAIPGHFGHDLTCWLFAGKFNNSCWDNATLAFKPELRAFSTLGQPNWLGAYLAAAFFIGLYYFVKIEKKKSTENLWNQLLIGSYLFLNFAMVLFTRSRSAILSVFIGLSIFTGYYFFVVKTNFKKILTVILILTVIPVLLFKTGEEKFDKYLSISRIKDQIFKTQVKSPAVKPKIQNLNVTESFDIRKIVWEGAWNLAVKYPLFGTGVETFAYSYNFVRPIEHNLTSEWDYIYNKAHNEYFNFLATTGFLGLGAYLSIIFVFMIYVVKRLRTKNLEILCLFTAWLTVLITNFFGFSTTTVQLLFYLIPGIIVANEIKPEKYKDDWRLSGYGWLSVCLVMIATIYLIFSISVYYFADVNYSYGLKYAKVNDQQKAASFFEKALKMRQEPVYMDRFSSSLAYLSAVASIQKQKDMAIQIANLADAYNRKTVQDYPKNVFYWKTRAKNMYYFFQITGKDNELLQGIEALKTARLLSPTDPKIPYSVSLYSSLLFDLNKNNIVEKEKWEKTSLEEIDVALKLKSNYREAYLMKGQLLKKYGQIGEARKTFEYILNTFNKKDPETLKELETM
jgi:O-antigen ligase